jgi:cell division protein ZapA
MAVRAMGQVTVNVNGRSYRFDCGDGEESRLQELATYVKDRIETLAQQFGRVGDERLLLMAALLITDELMDARAALGGTPQAAAGATADDAAKAGNQAKADPTKSDQAKAGQDKPGQEKPSQENSGQQKPGGSVLAAAKSRTAERREQNAIRSEHARRIATGDA